MALRENLLKLLIYFYFLIGKKEMWWVKITIWSILCFYWNSLLPINTVGNNRKDKIALHKNGGNVTMQEGARWR